MFYIAGAVKYLQQRFDIQKWQMRGASAGALVATLAACNVDSEVAFECAHRLSEEKKLFERPLGLAGTPCLLDLSPVSIPIQTDTGTLPRLLQALNVSAV